MKPSLKADESAAILVIRIMVGLVFLSEGIQKFLFPAIRGSGRFEKIGIPFSEFFGPFVGVNEILFGTLVLLGLFTRLAVLPLLCIMAVAIMTTKVPTLLNEGFWQMAHDIRNDWSMVMGLVFLLWAGPGPRSLDAKLWRQGRTAQRG